MKQFLLFSTTAATLSWYIDKKLLNTFRIDDIQESIYILGSFLLCLIITFVLSYILSRKWFKRNKWGFWVIVIPVIIGIVLQYFSYTKLYYQNTFTFTTKKVGEDGIPKPDKQFRVLRSNEYKDTIIQILKNDPDIDESRKDSILIKEWAGGFPNRLDLYKEGAIDKSRNKLLISFIILVCLCSTFILSFLMILDKQILALIRKISPTWKQLKE